MHIQQDNSVNEVSVQPAVPFITDLPILNLDPEVNKYATFMSVLYPSKEYLAAVAKIANITKRGRGRPRKDQQVDIEGVTKNALGDDSPDVDPVDSVTRQKIKRVFNRMYDEDDAVFEEILQALMVKFKLSRTIIFNIVN